jgi:site-specific DNA recombinase
MADALLSPYETKTTDFDYESNSTNWANLYNGEHIDTVYDNDEIMPKQNRIIVAYLRVSTDEQSVAMQRKYLEHKMKTDGINISKVVWIEEKEGVSASKNPKMTDRTEGRVLHEKLLRGELKVIYAYKLDRLFRDTAEGLTFAKLCKKLGTDIFTMETPMGVCDENGFILLTMHFMMAEVEVMKLSTRTTGGMDVQRDSGGVTTSAVFGWDVMELINEDGSPLIENDKVVKTVVPNWQEQAVINWIRTKVSEGKSNNWIATQLNSIGLKGKKGGKWQGQSIKRCLEAKQHSQIVKFNPPKRMMKWPFADLRKKQA